MSKPDASGAKSLEEILASIRKSLSGDSSETGGARPAPPPAETAAPDVAGDRALSQRLAGALGQSNGGTPDDDFTDLLAPQEASRAEPPPSSAPQGRSEARDPLWFLKRPADEEEKSTPGSGPTGTLPPTDEAVPRPLSADEIKLSRPEILRASLPPLFGAGDEQASISRPPGATKPAIDFTPAAPPRFAPVGPDEAAKPTPSLFTATQPLEPPAAGPPDAGSDVKAPASAGSRAAATTAAEPLASQAQPAAAATNGHSPPVRDTAKPVAAEPSPGNARTLEGAIGELLEPVIRQWLQANLPRLVEEMVRTEVARVLAADRGAGPKRDAPNV